MNSIAVRSNKKDEDEIAILIAVYLLSSFVFFPLSFTIWYLRNREKGLRVYYPALAILILSGISLTSYLYIYEPLVVKYNLNIGVWKSIVYGGIIAIPFFICRFFSPLRVSKISFIIFYLGCSLIVINNISWAILPQYCLLEGFDIASIIIISLGLAWIALIIFINIIFEPPEEGFQDKMNNWIKIIFVWLWLLLYLGITRIIYLTCGLA